MAEIRQCLVLTRFSFHAFPAAFSTWVIGPHCHLQMKIDLLLIIRTWCFIAAIKKIDQSEFVRKAPCVPT
jgi:hypothetical protein